MDVLFLLIKSLNKSEKRYLKLSSALQTGNKQYLSIFNILEKQEKYDEVLLISKLEAIGFFKKNTTAKKKQSSLRATKSYLRKLIFKSLRSLYEEEKEMNPFIDVHLLNADLAEARGLLNLTRQEQDKSRKIAQKYERADKLIAISRLDIAVLQHQQPKDATAKIIQLHEEIETLIETQRIENLYSKVYHQLYVAYRNGWRYAQNTAYLAALETQLTRPELEECCSTRSFYTHYLFQNIQGYYHLLHNEITAASAYFKNAVEVWEKKPHFAKEFPVLYSVQIYNHLNLCCLTGKYDEQFEECLKKMAAITPSNFRDKAFLFQNVYHLEFLYLLNTAKFEKTAELIAKIKIMLNLYEPHIPPARQATFRYNIITLHFLMGNYKIGLEESVAFAQLPFNECRKDLKARVQVFSLIMHYELGHYKLLGNLLEHIDRQLGRKKQRTPFLAIIVDMLSKIAYPDNIGISKKFEFYAVNGKIAALKSKLDQENIGGLGIEEIELWIAAKIQNTSIQQILLNQKASVF